MKVLKSYECMNACILNHMNRAGMEINGSDLFFSDRGYPVSYKKGSLTRIVSEGYEANFRFLDRYGLDYKFGYLHRNVYIKCGGDMSEYGVFDSAGNRTFSKICFQIKIFKCRRGIWHSIFSKRKGIGFVSIRNGIWD